MGKFTCLLLFLLLIPLCMFGMEMPRAPEYPVELTWGIPEDQAMTYFEGLPRTPEGETLDIAGDILKITMHAGSSYVIPIFAYSPENLEEVRYIGEGIPKHLQIQWLEPWNEYWVDITEIPEEFVVTEITEENDRWSVDFGPPEGALFSDDIPRYIWFRITPKETGSFEMTIHGWVESQPEGKRQVTNQLVLSAEVTGSR